VRESGLKIGYWCAWTNAGTSDDPGALSARGGNGHPEWLPVDVAPDAKSGEFWGVQKMCLACPEAKDWAITKTKELVSRDQLDYLKHDINMITVRCDRSTHRHSGESDISYWSVTGYYEVQDTLRKKFPSLVLENCSSGGCIKDFGVIKRSHYTVTTDTLANLANRMSIYDSTYAFPPLMLQAYTVEDWTPDLGDKPGTFLWRSAMMGAWVLDPKHVDQWSDDQRSEVKRCTEIYREWLRPVMRNCKVYHVLPRPNGKDWDGMFYWNPELTQGTLYVFRPDSKDNRKTVRLKGLDPAAKYRVWCEDGSIPEDVLAGSELMDRGLNIALPDTYNSDLIFIRKEKSGRTDETVE
jgi:alpha-galactosidase